MATSITFAYPDLETALNRAYYGFYCVENCWDYDSVNDKIYAIAKDSGTKLKLLEYKYKTLEIDYISEMNPANTIDDSLFPTMCYMNGKIYSITDADQDFGYYDLSGPVNNWTTLSGHPVALNNTTWDNRSLCSDYTRYIYAIDFEQTGGFVEKFYRYDTVTTSGWVALDNSYDMNANAGGGIPGFHHIWYDTSRDYIYLVMGMNETISPDYIQRYIVATDTWDTTYLYFGSLYTQLVDSTRAMAYYDDIIWLASSNAPNKLFKYDLNTALWSTINGVAFTLVANDAIDGSFLAIKDDIVFATYCSPGNSLIYNYNSPYSTITTHSGGYTTPIFKLDNKYNSSYFITQGDTTSGTGSISYDENVYDGTIRVKSSDTAPIAVEEVFWTYYGGTLGDDITVEKAIIYNGNITDVWAWVDTSSSYVPMGTAVNRRNGNVVISFSYLTSSGRMYMYDKSGNLLYSLSSNVARCGVNMEFDKFGGVWGYGSYFAYLIHYDNNFSTLLYSLYDGGADFLYDLAAEMDGDGVWYTNKSDDIVIHRDGDGTLLGSIIPLPEPRAICGTLDNGCWVIDNTNEKAYRYNSVSGLVKTVTLDRTATRMCTDMTDGFWYISGNHVYHVTSGGTEDADIELDQPTKIKGGHNGCIVWSTAQDYVKYIDKSTGVVTRTFDKPTLTVSSITAYPALFSFRVEENIDFQDTTSIIPATYDPVWGTDGTAEWQEVRKDGYFLPKDQYHRAEITVRGEAILEKISIPPTIKTQDIVAQQSKPIYIKTDIPTGSDITDYEARIKTWWGVE